jgi:GTP-binding protein Era
MTKKHGIIAIVGAPNAGKSTLTNSLIDQKITIVSPKVQTTRNSIKAIFNQGENQIILIDTPGIFIPKKDKILERYIAKGAWQALREADHICFVVDATLGLNNQNKQILEDLKKENLPTTIVINKIDLVKKTKILEIMADFVDLNFEYIIPINATQNIDKNGINELKELLVKKCQNDNWIFGEDQITDAPIKFLAEEITREKLFLKLNQELPYSIFIKTDSFQNFNNGDVKIYQTILVTKENHKNIVIGKRGNLLKEIGIEARKEISDLCQCKVHLFLFVKVKEDWMKTEL